jgi:hypothetical protein
MKNDHKYEIKPLVEKIGSDLDELLESLSPHDIGVLLSQEVPVLMEDDKKDAVKKLFSYLTRGSYGDALRWNIVHSLEKIAPSILDYEQRGATYLSLVHVLDRDNQQWVRDFGQRVMRTLNLPDEQFQIVKYEVERIEHRYGKTVQEEERNLPFKTLEAETDRLHRDYVAKARESKQVHKDDLVTLGALKENHQQKSKHFKRLNGVSYETVYDSDQHENPEKWLDARIKRLAVLEDPHPRKELREDLITAARILYKQKEQLDGFQERLERKMDNYVHSEKLAYDNAQSRLNRRKEEIDTLNYFQEIKRELLK